MAVPVGILLLTAAAGRLSDRIGVRLASTAGMLVLVGGAFLLTRTSPAGGVASVGRRRRTSFSPRMLAF